MNSADVEVDSDLTCSICDCLFVDPRVTPCGHSFCNTCFANWRQQPGGDACPLCRGRCPTDAELPLNVCLAGLVERRRNAPMAAGDTPGSFCDTSRGPISGSNSARLAEALLAGLLAALSVADGPGADQQELRRPLPAELGELLSNLSQPAQPPRLPPPRPPPPRLSTPLCSPASSTIGTSTPPPRPTAAATLRRSVNRESRRSLKRRAPPPPQTPPQASTPCRSVRLRRPAEQAPTRPLISMSRLRRWARSLW